MSGITEYAVSDIYDYIEKVIPLLVRNLSVKIWFSMVRGISY